MLTGRTRSLALAAAIVGVGFLGSRLLGVFRTIAIAANFGTSPELSAYWVAFRLPDLIFQVVAGATLASAFIPTFSRIFAREGEEQAWRLASSVINLVLVVTAILAVIGFALAGVLVPLTAPGLGDDVGRGPELRAEAVELTRIMLLSPLFFSVSGMFMGILNARHHFVLPALAPMFYNLSIMIAAITLSGPLGVHGLAYGVVAGSVLHLLVQVPGLAASGMRWQPIADWRDRAVREVARLMAPRMFGLAAAQINFLVATYFASRISHQAINALNYGFLLMMLPLGLFGMSVATAVFPTLAEHAATDQHDLMRRTLASTLRFTLFMVIPASVGLVIIREPLVVALFEHDEFDRASTAVTVSALLYYAFGMWAQAVVEVLSRGFYALADTRTPVAVAILAMVVNIAASVALKGPMGFEGLALALSIAAIVEAIVLYGLLWARMGAIGGRDAATSLLVTSVATLFMAGVVLLLAAAADRAGFRAPWSFGPAIVAVGVASAVGAAAFLCAAIFLRAEEAADLLARIGFGRWAVVGQGRRVPRR